MYLKSQHLILRNLNDSDIYDFYEVYSNANVTVNAGFYPIATYNEAKKFIELFKPQDEFAIELISENKLIGVIGFEDENDKIMINYLLNQNYWGNGYAGEALKTLIPFIKSKSNSPIYGDCFTDNFASKKVLEKCGFEFLNTYKRTYKSLNDEEKICLLFRLK